MVARIDALKIQRIAIVLNRLRNLTRTLARPLVSAARRALTPPPEVATLQFQKIQAGPAAGCEMWLPVPSKLADAITSDEYETDCLRVLKPLVSPTDTCYDIGAHYGVYTVVFAKLASHGAVHTFEPVSHLSAAIEQTLAKSQLNNVTLHRMAMANQSGTMTLRYASSAAGDDSMAYLEKYGGVNTPRSQVQYAHFEQTTVPCTALDLVTAPPPQFIKLDAEGAEVAILRGGLKLLQAAKPRLLIEIHGVDLALQCAQLLGSIGYVAIQVSSRSLAMPVLWIHRTDQQAFVALGATLGSSLTILYGELNEADRERA